MNDAVTTVLIREYGLGRHGWDMKPGDPVRFLLLLNSRATIAITAVVLTKTAFNVTLLRLADGATYKFVWFIIVSMNVLMGFSAAIPWIQCSPLAKGWDPTVPGTCWAPGVGTKIWIATGAYSALMDFILAGLPWTFLWSLWMRKKEKIGIAVAMSMGLMSVYMSSSGSYLPFFITLLTQVSSYQSRRCCHCQVLQASIHQSARRMYV